MAAQIRRALFLYVAVAVGSFLTAEAVILSSKAILASNRAAPCVETNCPAPHQVMAAHRMQVKTNLNLMARD